MRQKEAREVILLDRIEPCILLIRGQRMMLDADLAELYGTTTKALNQAVKRNRGRFPGDFLVQLTAAEKQEVVTNCDHLARLRFSRTLARTRQFVDLCRAASEGTTNRVRLQEERFLGMQIPLPPLPEQRRIVAKVEELAAKIEEARRLRDKSSMEVDSFLRVGMRQAFAARAQYQGASLESVCSSVVDCLHSNPVYSAEGVPTLRSPDVGWGTLNLAGAMRTSEAEYQRRTRRAEPLPGDIILVREGGSIGKAGMVREGDRCSLGQRVMMLRAHQERVLPEFLLYQWLSPRIQEEQLAPMMKGSASPHLNIKFLRRFSFVLPPLDDQRRIVAYLDDLQAKVDALKAMQTQTSAELDALLPSILDKAFKGELL